MPIDSDGWANRGWLEIIYRILELCEKNRFKTHVMYETGLNSRQLKEYLDFLVRCGMLHMTRVYPTSRRHFYMTTDKGKDFVARYKELVALFKIPQVQTTV
jgi:predicted transcriptional regulator